MIDLEQRLKAYYEAHYYDFHPEECEGYEEYLQKLKALETSPEAAKRLPARRRYVMPVAAAIMAAVSLGSGWAYLRLSQPVNPTVPDPDFVQAVTPPSADSSLQGSSKPEAPAAKPPVGKRDAELKPSADNIPPAKAEQGQTSNPTSDGTMSVKPGIYIHLR